MKLEHSTLSGYQIRLPYKFIAENVILYNLPESTITFTDMNYDSFYSSKKNRDGIISQPVYNLGDPVYF